MTFSESTLRSLNSFSNLCIIQAHLPAHPLCPICSPTFFPHFPLLPPYCLSSSLSSLLSASVFLIPLDIGGARYMHLCVSLKPTWGGDWHLALCCGGLSLLFSSFPISPLQSFLPLLQPLFLCPSGHWRNSTSLWEYGGRKVRFLTKNDPCMLLNWEGREKRVNKGGMCLCVWV